MFIRIVKDQGSRIGWSIENALDLKKSPFSVYSGPIIMAFEYQGECPGKVAKKNEKLRAALPLGTHCMYVCMYVCMYIYIYSDDCNSSAF